MMTSLIAHIVAFVVVATATQEDTTRWATPIRTKMNEVNVPWPNLTPTPRPNYGRTVKDPINVGGEFVCGAENQFRFLNTLRGPKGERCVFDRIGSCCPFVLLSNEHNGTGYLDRYVIQYEGLPTPDTLYLNFYTSSTVYIPTGYTARK